MARVGRRRYAAGKEKLKEAKEGLALGEKEDTVVATVVKLRGW